MIWARLKDAAIRAGLEPLLRPLVDRLRGKVPVEDDVAALALIARLAPEAVCVDIGCNKGIFLDPMRRAAPNGRFFAFEPVPYLYDLLKSKYRSDARVRVFNTALSSKSGTATLYVNTQDYGLSGLSDRPGCRGMDRASLRPVDVPVATLDALLGDQHVDFVKIDVEGAEFDVLQGAHGIITRSRPLILFEFGLGGADYFGVDAAKMYALLETLGYEVHTVADYIDGREALTLPAFTTHFNSNSKYNFVAAPKRFRA
jgi:FkbM family methyltransferase